MSGLERFAYPVPRIEDLAPPVAAALQAHLLSGEAVRQIIFAPRQSRFAERRRLVERLGAWLVEQWTPSWVLALTDERLLVAAIPEASQPLQITVTPLTDLLWLELGTILLYSWVAWSWVSAGQPQQQRVYFKHGKRCPLLGHGECDAPHHHRPIRPPPTGGRTPLRGL
jgi:hypothetical protein